MSRLLKRLPITCFAARTHDNYVLAESTSGGAFTEIAKTIIADGGVVFGAGWEAGSFRVVHKWVDTVAELSELRGTKYTVSDMSGVYVPIRRFLAEGRRVLFVGTPCQTAAIRKVVGEDSNLYICALICMSNADAKLWEAYVQDLNHSSKSEILKINHRRKVASQTGDYFCVEFANGQKILEKRYSNRYWKMFSEHPRSVCLACQFRTGRHGADLQIGDFWGVEKVFPDLADGRGVSVILSYTPRGAQLLSRVDMDLRPARYEDVLRGNPFLEQQRVLPPRQGLLVGLLGCIVNRIKVVARRILMRSGMFGGK